MRLRIWGLPVLRSWANLDPIQHLGDPDATPVPTMTGTGIADPDGPPGDASEPEVEILDVPPEIRDWDVAKTPAPDHAPHCDGRHGDGHPTKLGTTRCEYCDALTGAITLVRSLEKRVAELEERDAVKAERIAALETAEVHR